MHITILCIRIADDEYYSLMVINDGIHVKGGRCREMQLANAFKMSARRD